MRSRTVSLPGSGLLVALACVGACAEDESRYPPPGKWVYPPSPIGGAEDTTGSLTTSNADTGGDTGTRGDTGTADTGTADTGSDTGTAVRDLLAGVFVPAAEVDYTLPIQCAIRFHAPGLIEPSTGIDSGHTLLRSFPVAAWPSSFAVTAQETGVLEPGDIGFVTAQCDVDDDGLLNDGVGGYWPGLPLEQVTIPATDLELVIGPLP